MEKLRRRALERQSRELLKTTRWGRIYGVAYLFIGVCSVSVYIFVFKFHTVSSILLGLITWFVLSFAVDTILVKTQRIDKQLDWLLKTPQGLAELKRKGITEEQIEEMKKNIENDFLYKKFSLDNYTKSEDKEVNHL